MLNWHRKKGEIFVVAGKARGETRLTAFDSAALSCGIEAMNAIPVTSFLPPKWEVRVDEEELGRRATNGRFVPTALKYETVKGEKTSAAISVGVPSDKERPGIIAEHAESDLEESEARVILL